MPGFLQNEKDMDLMMRNDSLLLKEAGKENAKKTDEEIFIEI